LYCYYRRSIMRSSRVQFPGAFHHVYSRGNGKQNIFEDTSDRNLFMRLLESTICDCSWICHSFCLMQNHYHLLLETPEAMLSEGMQFLNGVYSSLFNKKYGRVGHVMQGRYHSPLVTNDGYFLELLRYMALNPVKSGFVEDPGQWNWSSYRGLSGLSPAPTFLRRDFVLNMFSSSANKAEQEYMTFVRERLASARLGFITHRPPLGELFVDVQDKHQRNKAIAAAHHDYGYSLTEIAEFLDKSRSAICRACKNNQLSEASNDEGEVNTPPSLP